jgi:hypothetical protein
VGDPESQGNSRAQDRRLSTCKRAEAGKSNKVTWVTGSAAPGEPGEMEVWGARQSSSMTARTGGIVVTQAEQLQGSQDRWKCGDPGRASIGEPGQVGVW